MTRRLQIVIDYDRCVGSSICILTAPGVFALNDDRQSTVTDAQGEDAEKVLQAAEGCPMLAISVVDSDTGERLFPLS